MRDMTEIRNQIEDILNAYDPFKTKRNKETVIHHLLQIIEREQNKSYDNGYRLKFQRRTQNTNEPIV